ncbi:hypothetical protein TNCV_4385331 [Trichonephila clavipes]|nr:hypothetical protein TNCV_4385331 [Trichonephila clavipes]
MVGITQAAANGKRGVSEGVNDPMMDERLGFLFSLVATGEGSEFALKSSAEKVVSIQVFSTELQSANSIGGSMDATRFIEEDNNAGKQATGYHHSSNSITIRIHTRTPKYCRVFSSDFAPATGGREKNPTPPMSLNPD